MSNDELSPDSVYSGLKEIWNTEFPKTCASCGRTFGNITEFLALTSPPESHTGLQDYEDSPGSKRVGLFRNCSCGSTMATFCNDRRDTSSSGVLRRELFEKLLVRFEAAGIARPVAREKLLAALRGGGVETLTRLLG